MKKDLELIGKKLTDIPSKQKCNQETYPKVLKS